MTAEEEPPNTHFPTVFTLAKGGLYGGFINGALITDPNVAALIMDYRWTTSLAGTTPATTVTYAFPQSASDYKIFPAPNTVDPVSHVPINDIQKEAVLTAFGLVSSYTKLNFVEAQSGSADDATFRFAQTSAGGSEARFPTNEGAWEGYKSDSRDAGDNFLGGNGNPAARYYGTDEFNTIMHEFGHSMGLKHGHDPSIHGALADLRNDNEFSVMTYASYLGSNIDKGPTLAVNGSSPQSFMMYDIAALQALYGANFDKLGTAATYTWDPGTGQESIGNRPAPFTGTTVSNKIFSTVWTQGAAATYDLHNFGQDQIDDLRPGHWLRFSDGQLADLNRDDASDAAFKAQGNVYNALLYNGDLRSAIADLITGSGDDTLIGNDRDNKLFGGDGNDILVANGGNDTLVGGNGADKFYFGPGNSVARDNLSALNGDTMIDFGFHASVDILGSRIGRDSMTITPTKVMVSANGDSFELDGNFASGGSAGGLIIAARGAGDSSYTTVSHVNFTPNLREGVAVDPAAINGIANQNYLSGDGTVAFTVEMKSAVSAFANTLGYYKVGTDGKISDVHILFGNTLGTASGTTANLITPGFGERIGFFLIQNGANTVGPLPDDLSFVTPGTGSAANLNQGIAPALVSASHGAITGVDIFHSFANINPNAATQVLSGLDRGGRELQIGFEDLRNGTGDNDFQDVVIGVHTTNHNDIFIL
jgi:Ca2+-binding RTX toxin-like protein